MTSVPSAYVALAVGLILFGFLGVFSVGLPFLVTGVLMLGLLPVRHRRDVLAPALAWPWAFTLGYLIVAPLGCTTTASGGGGGQGTRCDALFLTYAGDGAYSPPLLPAALFGLAVATAVTLIIRRTLRRTDDPAA